MAGSVPLLLATGQTWPIQLHVVRSRSKVQSQRIPTYGGYSSANMDKAHETVIAGRMPVRKAAKEHGMPRSSLHNRVTGRVALKAWCGAKKHLTNEEEASLVDYLIGCASVGYAKSCKDVLAIAQRTATTHNPNMEITIGGGGTPSVPGILR